MIPGLARGSVGPFSAANGALEVLYGGTGGRSPAEAAKNLGVPSLDANNVFTGVNEFQGMLQSNGGLEITLLPGDALNIVDSSGSINVLDFSASNGATYALQVGGGTLALLSDITAGGGNGVVVAVDFGSAFTPFTSVVVTGETWVAAGSKIAITPKADTGTEVEVALMAFSCVVSDLVAGVGFTLNVFTPIEAKGTYTFSCVGV